MLVPDDVSGRTRQSGHDPGLLPPWQAQKLREQLGYLFAIHVLAAGVMHGIVLESTQWRTKVAWTTLFLSAWLCGAVWIAVHANLASIRRDANGAMRMAAIGIFLCSSPWVLTPILIEGENPTNTAILLAVLIMLGAMTSYAIHVHYASCIVSLLCILAPPACLLLVAGQPRDQELSVCLLGGLGGMIAMSLRASRAALESAHSDLAGRDLICTLETQLELHRAAVERAEKAVRIAEQECMERTRFLATASHDLRQPIHAISLFVAALRSESFENRTRYLVDRLDRALCGLDSLFNRLLDISRIDAGLVTSVLANVDARTLAQTLESRFAPLAQRKCLDFRVHCPPGLRLRTDAELLTELLSNLLANALRYTDQGAILLSFRKRQDAVLIQVWDTGCGIPETQIELVFDEFVQLHNPTRDRRRGLGLGLAIVKRLAGALDHQLAVRSRVGSGSCFSLTVQRDTAMLPAADEIMPASPAEDVTGALVLVVDDEIDILAGMEALLSSWGCIPLLARSPEEASLYVANSARFPDVVITDHRLDDHKTCFDVAAVVAPLIPYPVPLVVVSGESSQALEAEVSSAGWLFMRKPVDAQALHATVGTAMRQTRDLLRQAA